MLVWIIAAIALYKILELVYYKVTAKNPTPDDVVLITGGCSGLGRQVALHYAAAKCTVVIWDIAEHSFEKITTEITKVGGKPIVMK
jgi:NADP-dependent 3-hydroxy acid dehydrogenase YdfG